MAYAIWSKHTDCRICGAENIYLLKPLVRIRRFREQFGKWFWSIGMNDFDAARLVLFQFDLTHEGRRYVIAALGVSLINEGSHLSRRAEPSDTDEDMDLLHGHPYSITRRRYKTFKPA